MGKQVPLDFNLKTPEERVEYLKAQLQDADLEDFTPKQLKMFSDYIIFAINKAERKKKEIITDNREVTIEGREVSYEGLEEAFGGNEDAIYNLISGDDKGIIFSPKKKISKKDYEKIPELKNLKDEIEKTEERMKKTSGRTQKKLKKQIIEMYKDLFVIYQESVKPIHCVNMVKQISEIDLSENITLNERKEPISDCLISFLNYRHISLLLCNYSEMKQQMYGKFWADGYYLMEALDDLVDRALKERYPVYLTIIELKIDGLTNREIQDKIQEQYGLVYSPEHISCLWRNKIPKKIAEQAKRDYMYWYFTNVVKGEWKKCSRCHEIKPATNMFFTNNKSSKDGLYGVCKECRAKRYKEVKQKSGDR